MQRAKNFPDVKLHALFVPKKITWSIDIRCRSSVKYLATLVLNLKCLMRPSRRKMKIQIDWTAAKHPSHIVWSNETAFTMYNRLTKFNTF